jgi:hypothetical protein
VTKKQPKKAVSKRQRPASKRLALKRPTAKKKAPKARKPPLKKRPVRKLKKVRKAPIRTPIVVARIQRDFLRIRKKRQKKKKTIVPPFQKKKGKIVLRGADGKERSLMAQDFWENLKEGWLEHQAMKAFQSLFSEFRLPPTLYARFTFTVSNVRTTLTAGSPKIIRSRQKSMKHWFLSSGLSYSIEGMRRQFQKAWDTIDAEIKDATSTNPHALFFLEFITCLAYTVKN